MTVSVAEVGGRLAQAAEVCEQHGVRFTELRREILSLILAANKPVGAYDLLDQLKEKRKKAAPPTIYRALDFLRAQGLIHRVERLNAFIACPNEGRHAHPVQFLICRLCGAVDELQDRQIVAAIEQAMTCRGFRPALMTLEVEGTCFACLVAPDGATFANSPHGAAR